MPEQPSTADDPLDDMLRELAARHGHDLDVLAAQAPDPFDPVGWRQDDPDFHRDLARRILAYEASGEFHPDRLPPIHEFVAEWVAAQKRDPNEAPWLILRGRTGCGKTSQAFNAVIALAMHAADEGRRYRWRAVSHREFAAEVRPGGAMDPEAVMEKYMEADLVAFSDLGDFQPTDFAKACTSRLIDHRYHHRKATVYDTNLLFRRSQWVLDKEREMAAQGGGTPVHIATLQDTLDDRILSRLEAGWIAKLPGVDHRLGSGRRFG